MVAFPNKSTDKVYLLTDKWNKINAQISTDVSTDAFICDYIRTPIGRFGGTLSSVRPDDLAAMPITALMDRNPKVDWNALDDIFYGCANQAGEDNRNVARMAAYYRVCPSPPPA